MNKIPCEILRPFTFSEDGVTALVAVVGDVSAIPLAWVDGLKAEGYVRAASGSAPANKMIEAAPVLSAPVAFNGADPSAFDHDNDGQPGGSEAGPELTPGEIPTDWPSLQWKRRVKLASDLSGADVAGVEEANAIIAAEVARRAAVEAQDGQ